MKADINVNLALKSQLSRESQWVGKSSTLVQCHSIFEEISENVMVPTINNCLDFEKTVAEQMPKLKEAAKSQIQLIYLEKWNEKVRKLLIQGDFLNLLISEQSNVSWKSIIYGVPRGVMQFAMRSSTNTLATSDNLKRWKKVASDTCKMCLKPNCRPSKATLFHILNHCEAFLGERERYVFRHNSILSYITLTLKENTPDNITIYADLDGHKVNGGTLPPHITVTSSRCDLVIIDSSSTPSTVYLLELTVSFERPGNMEAAYQRKYERYTALSEDIKAAGFNCKNIPFEVGSRGHLTLENKSKLSIMHSLCKPKTKYSKFWQNVTKTSLLCSYSIYLSREDPWTEVPLISPVNK